jgi:pilus assembly protein CpaF
MGRFSLARPQAPQPAQPAAPVAAPTPAARVETKAKAPPRDANLDLRLRLHTRLIDELELAKLD